MPDTSRALLAYRYSFDDVVVDERRFELKVAGELVEVQPKTFDILLVLLEAVGEVVRTEEFAKVIWPDSTAEEISGSLSVQMKKLRDALGEKSAQRIVTVPRVGFRFEGPVDRLPTGRKFTGELTLNVGMQVPRRGNFALVELLGRSRHSEVWRAQHTKTGEQRVYKFTATGEGLAALKREVTLFRVLHETLGERPDLVRIIDWDFTDPPFFLECEDGRQNLAQWAEDQGHLRELPLAQRLDLFLQIADAVAEAHSVGVLHKDLKPTNILITPKPDGWQIKLTDFGSGRLLDPEALKRHNITAHGLTLSESISSDSAPGTELYLAPELFKGQSTTIQSDVYALGLLLYQITVGDLDKFMASGWERNVSDELLRKDIAAATDGDPVHRLGSADKLADQVRSLGQRHEEERRKLEIAEHNRAAEERARVAEEAARTAKVALERTRLRQRALVAFIVPLILGLGGMAWLYRDAIHARTEAETQAKRAEAVNEFYSKDVFNDASPINGPKEDNPRIRDVLANAGKRAETYFPNDTLSKAAVYDSVGATYEGMGDFAHATEYWRQALKYTVAASGENNRQALGLKYRLALSLSALGKLDEAGKLIDEADAISSPFQKQDWKLAVEAASTRGTFYQMSMNPAKVIENFTVALKIQTEHDPNAIDSLANGRIAMADSYMRINKFDEGRAMLEPIVNRAPGWEKLAPAIHATATDVLGQVETQARNYDKAEILIKQAYDELSPIDGPSKLRSTKMLLDLADVLGGKGDFAGALDQYQKAYPIFAKAEGDSSLFTLMIKTLIGQMQYFTGDSAGALQTLDPLTPRLVTLLGATHPGTELSSFWLAALLLDAGKTDRAEALLKPLSVDVLNSISPDAPWQDELDELRGEVLIQRGKKDEGIALLKHSLDSLSHQKIPSWYANSVRRHLQQAGAG